MLHDAHHARQSTGGTYGGRISCSFRFQALETTTPFSAGIHGIPATGNAEHQHCQGRDATLESNAQRWQFTRWSNLSLDIVQQDREES